MNVANPISVTSGRLEMIEVNTGGATPTESGLITLLPAGTVGATGSTVNLANANVNSTLNITGGIVGTGNVLFGNSITTGRNKFQCDRQRREREQCRHGHQPVRLPARVAP